MDYPGDKFNSTDVDLRANSWEKKIVGYSIGSNYWRDVGSQSELYQAEKDIRKGHCKLSS